MRIFRHSLDRKIRGHKKYRGNAEQICRQTVTDCWNGKFFQTSSGHFSQFYARDFGLCADALLKLGYADEIKKTLAYALGKYEKHGRMAVALTPKGQPFDFPGYAIDTLPFLIHSLKVAKASGLVSRHRQLIEREIGRLFHLGIDKDTGLVKRNASFSSMKDYAIRSSSCYDNSMVAMLSKCLKELKLKNPFSGYNYPKLLKDFFWNGSYFLDDFNSKHVAGDANIFPYWTGAIKSKEMMKKSFSAIMDAGLDKPFPLKYTNKTANQRMISYELLVKGWQKDAIWAQMGPLYIKLLSRVDRKAAEKHMETYKNLIGRNMAYMEVYSANGKPFSTPFYHSDAGMLWAALYLVI